MPKIPDASSNLAWIEEEGGSAARTTAELDLKEGAVVDMYMAVFGERTARHDCDDLHMLTIKDDLWSEKEAVVRLNGKFTFQPS
jgi:hypothetical protein